MAQGFSRVLSKGKKKPWSAFPLVIGPYVVKNFEKVEVKIESLKGSHFVTLNYRMYNPKKASHYKGGNFN